jgi:uncharacterized protein YabN with tetrapyrrole methylase and pyrophosphatase domain
MRRLFVIGSGIKTLAHLSKETLFLIQNVDRLLYLVNDKIMSDFLLRELENASSLDDTYFKYTKRQDAYNAVTDRIVSEYYQYNSLCVLVYGHPTFFADFALKAVKQIQKQGGSATILPAISSLDCLIADLLISPGQEGMCIYDATELLVYERNIDIYSYLVLYQVSSLGMVDTKLSKYIHILKKYLLKFYSESHCVYIYSASQTPGLEYNLEEIELREIDAAPIHHKSTICLPPIKPKRTNLEILNILGIKLGS